MTEHFLIHCSYLLSSFEPTGNAKGVPSFTHLCVIVHLFGTVRYVFQMSRSERMKFFDGKN